VAAAAGCHRNTLERWRNTEAWEIALRQAGTEYVESLAPAAVAGLLKSWERGNAAGAIEVLRALGFLKLPTAAVRRIQHVSELNLDRAAAGVGASEVAPETAQEGCHVDPGVRVERIVFDGNEGDGDAIFSRDRRRL
jgi:hypothetical protein